MNEFHHPMQVVRRHAGASSWIEPPLENAWEDLDKLRWQAGVLLVDTGIRATITQHSDFFGPKYGLQFSFGADPSSTSTTAMDFGYAWAYMSHVSLGAELVQGGKL